MTTATRQQHLQMLWVGDADAATCKVVKRSAKFVTVDVDGFGVKRVAVNPAIRVRAACPWAATAWPPALSHPRGGLSHEERPSGHRLGKFVASSSCCPLHIGPVFRPRWWPVTCASAALERTSDVAPPKPQPLHLELFHRRPHGL